MHRLESVRALRCFRLAKLAGQGLAMLTAFGCAGFTFGCASGAAKSDAAAEKTQPIRIRYLAYASGQRLELVNPAHSDPTELYSSTRPLADAGRKVSTAEVMDETLEYFRKRGFYEKSEAGPAPPTAEGVWLQSLEVETPGKLVHMSLHRGATEADRRVFLECAQAFVTIYNNTYQLQSVDQAPDWGPKRSQPDAARSKPPDGGSGGRTP